MGYLDNSIVTVDAILTKKGRELLARGDGSFKITQFALEMMRLITPYTIHYIPLVLHSMEKLSKTYRYWKLSQTRLKL